MHQIRQASHESCIRFRRGFLQADEAERLRQQRREAVEGNRAIAVLPVKAVARPCKPDQRRTPLPQARSPNVRPFRVGTKVGNPCRNGAEVGLERQRQAEQGAMVIERRQVLLAGKRHRRAVDPRLSVSGAMVLVASLMALKSPAAGNRPGRLPRLAFSNPKGPSACGSR
jgi:hypothetical protein